MNATQHTITVFILLLLVASGVAMVTKWVRLPYTLALVIVGLVIGPLHLLPPIHISPELILLIFLPALLFEAAWNLKLERLRANVVSISILAIVGVGISAGVIGGIVHYAVHLSWASSLLFGAIVSATDPVSVLALFRKLGAPARLSFIIEGESLFNDGTAAVLFRILAGIVAGATASRSHWQLALSSLLQFITILAGGIAVGTAIGFLASMLTSYFDDHLLEIMLTTIAAYGSYLLAELIHVSPVITVIVTGIMIGNPGRRAHMSANTQVAVDSFWEYQAFVVNSLVFLIIGLEIPLSLLALHAVFIAWAVLAMVLSRALVIYGLFPFINRLGPPVPGRWQHILFWGGLRGSLSIALVLSLPLVTPNRVQLVAMTFGAVTFSLLGQGLMISPLLKVLKLETREDRR
jgi:monovalent cation:H+ antiporter, CPA1 family